MAKGFKLRLSFPSIRLCRSKIPFVVSPPIFTPLNPKVFDITYPRLPTLHTLGSCASKLSPICESSCSNAESPAFQKLFNSPVVEELEETVWSSSDNWDHEVEINETENDNNHDPFLTSLSMSFSSVEPYDSSCDFGYSLKTINEAKAYAIKRRKGNPKVYKNDEEKATVIEIETLPEKDKVTKMTRSPVKKTVFDQKLMPCMVEGKVNESYAVMKKSEDPYEDFKKSMMEMILKKQISEAEDLEKLLMCFLSLNAKDHHQVIVEAFSQVWEELFSKS